MKCLRCKRPLKNPKNIVIGYGKVCASKVRTMIKTRNLLEFVREKKVVEKKKTEIVL